MSPHQMNTYQLAENLGMTVTRMQREMTLAEFYGWIAFYGERDRKDAGRDKPKPKPAARPTGKRGEVSVRGFAV